MLFLREPGISLGEASAAQDYAAHGHVSVFAAVCFVSKTPHTAELHSAPSGILPGTAWVYHLLTSPGSREGAHTPCFGWYLVIWFPGPRQKYLQIRTFLNVRNSSWSDSRSHYSLTLQSFTLNCWQNGRSAPCLLMQNRTWRKIPSVPALSGFQSCRSI